MTYLLDTNHASAVLDGQAQLVGRIKQGKAQGHHFGITTTVLGELYFGAYASGRREENLARLQRFLSDVLVFEFDMGAADEFGRLLAEQKSKGKPIPQSDAHIAAVARLHRLTLLTADQHFSLVDNLVIENWLA